MTNIAIDVSNRVETADGVCSECNNSGVYIVLNAYDADYQQPVICSCAAGRKVFEAFNTEKDVTSAPVQDKE